MIGQTKLLESVHNLTASNKFPRFTILVGAPGSGRHLICRQIAKELHAERVQFVGTSAEAVRTMIDDANNSPDVSVYIIPDADSMSAAARNSMLKVTEEPPQNAYIIMTVVALSNVLSTLRSRGTIMLMDNYTYQEIDECIDQMYDDISESDRDILHEVCDVPGDILEMKLYAPKEFKDFVTKVYTCIGTVSDTNAFKIAQDIKLKDTDKGYSISLFFKLFISICMTKYLDDIGLHSALVYTTFKKLGELSITGVNRAALFDAWILNVRRCFDEYS